MPTRPPPNVPATIEQPVADYLRRLSLWAFQEIDKAVKQDEAAAHLTLIAFDQKQNPNIFRIEVDHTGALRSAQAPLGQGKP